MKFGLSTKYTSIDFEAVHLASLRLIGGGCGGGGGGGGGGSTTVQTVQAALQAASNAPGANTGVSVTVGVPLTAGGLEMRWRTQPFVPLLEPITGSANVSSNGSVTASSSNGGGGFWSSVASFFSWLFGSH